MVEKSINIYAHSYKYYSYSLLKYFSEALGKYYRRNLWE